MVFNVVRINVIIWALQYVIRKSKVNKSPFGLMDPCQIELIARPRPLTACNLHLLIALIFEIDDRNLMYLKAQNLFTVAS